MSNPLDRFQYGYDRNGNRMYRENLIDADFSELYHANGESAGYDLFNQLTDYSRGVLSDSGSDDIPDTISDPDREQAWDLDAMGNWESITTDSVEEERVHNKQNQVTDVEANELDFDDNGNTITDEQGNALVYDAWNRLVSFDNGTDSVTYAYDALGRRIQRTFDSETTDFFYSDKWQVLEDRVSGDASAQYVWSPVYVDAMVLRDRDNDANPDLEERVYVLQDANWNVTALANAAGTVLERYAYDPYGTATVYEDDWTNPGDASTSAHDWVYLHQSGRFDVTSGMYHFRNRELSPTLGRWIQVDPIRYSAGDTNLYRYVSNSPLSKTDPTGLFVAQDSPDASAAQEEFYVCGRTTQTGGIADDCGCKHTDIYGDQGGEAYTGGYGGCPPTKGGGLPKGPGWKCTRLPIKGTQVVEGLGGIPRLEERTIMWGPKAGQSCKGATSSDVRACLQGKPKIRPTAKDEIGTVVQGMFWNCQTDCFVAAEGCCLDTSDFHPMQLIPVRPMHPGPKW